MAFGRAGRFYDMTREEQVQTLAVLLHMRTEEGARESVLPSTYATTITFENDRAKARKRTQRTGGR